MEEAAVVAASAVVAVLADLAGEVPEAVEQAAVGRSEIE